MSRPTIKELARTIYHAHLQQFWLVAKIIGVALVAYILPAWLVLACAMEVILGSSPLLSTFAVFMGAAIVTGIVELSVSAAETISLKLLLLKRTWPVIPFLYRQVPTTRYWILMRNYYRLSVQTMRNRCRIAASTLMRPMEIVQREFRLRVMQ